MNQETAVDFSDLNAPDMHLPVLSDDQVSARNIASRRQMDGPLALGGRKMVYYQTYDSDATPRLGTQVELSLNDERVTLYLDGDPRDLLPPLSEVEVDLDRLKPDRLALVVEHVLSPELEALEASWGCRIVLEEIHLERLFAPFDTICGWRLEAEGQADQDADAGPLGHAFLDPRRRVEVAQHLAGLFPERQRTSVATLKTEVVFCAGICELAPSDLQRLTAGSVLFPDENWTADRPVLQYLIWNRDIAPVAAVDGGLRLMAQNRKLDEIVRTETRSIAMNSGDAFTTATTQVTIELAREEMSFAELEQLSEGVIVDFQLPEVQTVTLSTGGKPIARGQLVQLEQKIGIQITELL